MKAHHFIAVLFVLSVAVTVQAKFYKRVDGNGKTHFADAKPGSAAITIEEKAYPVAPASAKDVPKTQTVAASPQVDIYVTSWCPYCKKALAFLRSHNITFNVYDIELDSDAEARKKALDPGFSGIPLTVVNGEVIRGFDEETFHAKLLPQTP